MSLNSAQLPMKIYINPQEIERPYRLSEIARLVETPLKRILVEVIQLIEEGRVHAHDVELILEEDCLVSAWCVTLLLMVVDPSSDALLKVAKYYVECGDHRINQDYSSRIYLTAITLQYQLKNFELERQLNAMELKEEGLRQFLECCQPITQLAS